MAKPCLLRADETNCSLPEDIAAGIRDEHPGERPDDRRKLRLLSQTRRRKPWRKDGWCVLPQFVELGDAVHAADCAVRSAALHLF